jgi:purine-binding chemotaxis protein CheW
MSQKRQLCTFQVGDLGFGVEVKHVQEVIRLLPLTRVPLAPGLVRGLLNLRGQIVTALDVRARLDLPPLSPALEPMTVVVRAGEGVVGLLVDQVGDVLEVDQTSFERVPETLPARLRELVRGVFKLETRLLLLLDVERIIVLPEDETAGPRPAPHPLSTKTHAAARGATDPA